jgi:hypothetical protein
MRCVCCPVPKVKRWGRLHVGNRYIWLEFHPWVGPSFTTDSGGVKPYDPVDENDPVWPHFMAWLEKFNAAEAKARCKRTVK